MTQLQNSVGKPEYVDVTNAVFTIACENWVLNTIANVSPCLVATTANLTATYSNGTAGVGATLTNSGTQTALVIDTVIMAVGNRVTVKDQSTGFQNGIYVVTNIGSISTNWILTRVADFDSVIQTTQGKVVSVISGTNGPSLWMLTSIVTTIGTDSLNFAKLNQNSFTSILGTANQITVTVANGVATISLADNPIIPGTASVTIPTGTTAQRPGSPTVGMLRFNTSL